MPPFQPPISWQESWTVSTPGAKAKRDPKLMFQAILAAGRKKNHIATGTGDTGLIFLGDSSPSSAS